MKVSRAIYCLVVPSISVFLGTSILTGFPGSWIEILMGLAEVIVLVGVVWLLAFLPLLYFTRRFEIWGYRKAGVIGSLLGLAFSFVMGWLNQSGHGMVILFSQAVFGLSIGLLFALGSVMSSERWPRISGQVFLWILGAACVLMVVFQHPKEGALKADRATEHRKIMGTAYQLMGAGKVREALDALSSVPWDSPVILQARLRISQACTQIRFAPAQPRPESEVPIFVGEVVRSMPHDTNAYNEGLAYQGGFLYESANVGKLRLILKNNA